MGYTRLSLETNISSKNWIATSGNVAPKSNNPPRPVSSAAKGNKDLIVHNLYITILFVYYDLLSNK